MDADEALSFQLREDRLHSEDVLSEEVRSAKEVLLREPPQLHPVDDEVRRLGCTRRQDQVCLPEDLRLEVRDEGGQEAGAYLLP